MSEEQKITAVYYTCHRYGTTATFEEDSLQDALDRAIADVDYNDAYPLRIEAIDGSFSYERSEPGQWDGPLDRLMLDRRLAAFDKIMECLVDFGCSAEQASKALAKFGEYGITNK